MSRANFYGLVVFLLGGFGYLTRPNKPGNVTFTLSLSEPLHLYANKEDMYEYPDVACSNVFVKRYTIPVVNEGVESVSVDEVRFVFAKDFYIDIGIADILTTLSYAERTLPLSLITDNVINEEVPYFDDVLLKNNCTPLKTKCGEQFSIIQISGDSKFTNYFVHVSSTLVIGQYSREWGEFTIPVPSGMYLTSLLTKATFFGTVPEFTIIETCEAIQEYLNGLEQ